MPLKHLELNETNVADLSPLKGCPIETLTLGKTAVTDVSPLVESPLKRLELWLTRVSNLSPLRSLPLEHLNLDYTDATDLSPLDGLSISKLNVFGCWIKDYAPLASMDNLDREKRPSIPFLLGEITEQQFYERMQERRTEKYTAEDVSQQVIIFIAMKKYADDGPAAAIAVLEKYKEKWETEPPPWGDPDFIEALLKRLRRELADQPAAQSPTEAGR